LDRNNAVLPRGVWTWVHPEGEVHGSYSTFYYQLEDANGNPLTGSGYSLEEDVSPADANTPSAGQTSNGEFVALPNGVATDVVGWARQDPVTGNWYGVPVPESADLLYNQTFAVQYQGQTYNLTTEFQHENFSMNGVADNSVYPIRQ
jgi:hypothetical protein